MSQGEALPSWPIKAWLWIRTNGHILLQGAGAILMGVASATVSLQLLFSGATLSFIGLVWGLLAAPRVHELLDQREAARMRADERTEGFQEVLRLILNETASQMNLDLSNTRMSVYTHGNSSFSMVKRHSTNPVLREPSRNSYPDSEGLIGSVWQTGDCTLVQNLPKDRDKWNEKCSSKWGIPIATAESLSMQARSLIGRRIDRADQEPVGLIILESTEPTGLTGAHRDHLEDFSGVLLEVLTLIIHKMDEQDGLCAKPNQPPSSRP